MISSKKRLPKKVLLLGSGGLRIGQAGEFDYSGSQAIKALKEENVRVVLVNPNISTIQTDDSMADTLYLEPLNVERVEKIIKKEQPDAILLSFGGQTALNLGLALHDRGILKTYGVRTLGTSIEVIRRTEDRGLFKRALAEIAVATPKSSSASTVAEAIGAAKRLGYPIMMRSGYSLGGLGSGKISSEDELKDRARVALTGAPQILIEEYLDGWKEIEYEIMRDCDGNAVTICNMENFDPMGVHTGESIVVAPSQTLTNEEYHSLREIAIKTAQHLGIVGECNIQYALHPETGEYRVIEVNARLSRSSALASKATGYPLAFVSAKLSLGYRLHEIKNAVTKKTCAFFEPALDYLVVKIPRWDMTKFKSTDRRIGSEMKSVGEVMGIGRSFPEALQKAVRMLNIGADGVTDHPFDIPNPKKEICEPTDRRLFALADYFMNGGSVSEAHASSKIDPWFLHHIKTIAQLDKKLRRKSLTAELLHYAKRVGFSDKTIANRRNTTTKAVRKQRMRQGIRPVVKQIDTLAGEFPAETNYLYLTYHGETDDVTPSKKRPIIILGSGPYCIGSSVEFDWCAVNTARTLRAEKEQTIIINSNPETVSTDYDESNRLYFEELSFERVRDIADFEKSRGIIVSVGGQIANNLALPLANAGYRILGSAADSIDAAEDRKRFSILLSTLSIDQPEWIHAKSIAAAIAFAGINAYPVLIRPSYVLSGAAMNVVYSEEELTSYLEAATLMSSDHPVVISKFIEKAKELEIDGVAKNGRVVIEAVSEHIEHAGVHSGDATIVLPPQRLYLETIRRTKRIAAQIVAALRVSGPFNIQFLAKDNEIKVIECNLRASRSFPFVSKVTGHNFIRIAARILAGKPLSNTQYETLELNHVGVKMPQFSYQRLKGADPIAGVEMASTGEVATIGRNELEAFLLAWLATEQTIRGKRLFVSIGGAEKENFISVLKTLEENGWDISATEGTQEALSRHGVGARCLYKTSDETEPNIATAIANKHVDIIVNIPTGKRRHETDGYIIRRLAIDHNIPLITNAKVAEVFLKCLTTLDTKSIPVLSWQELIPNRI